MRPTPVIQWLLIIHFAVFCLQCIFDWMGNPLFQNLFELYTPAIRRGCLWQFFTYMFLHGNVWHLLFNLLALYFFGVEVESAMGSRRLLWMYLTGGLVGGIFWYLFNYNHIAAMVGASGAIYAVIIAFATLYPDRPITLLVFFVLPITLLAKYLAIAVVAISILFSMSGGGDHIAHLAHLGGAAVGYIFVRFNFNIPSWRFPLPRWFRWKPGNLTGFFRKTSDPKRNEEFLKEQIDPILDKIAEHGIQSLTPKERRLLEEAKDRLI